MNVYTIELLYSLLYFHGRTISDERRNALFFNWTCSGFTVRFTGRNLFAQICAVPGLPLTNTEPIEDYPWIGVVREDGTEIMRRMECRSENGRYELFSAGVSGPHTVTVVKLSENTRGKVGLIALESDGEIIPFTSKKSRLQIEFIGDSITCGFGNEAPGRDSSFCTAEENGWMTYAAIAARELGADFRSVCVSGISAASPKHSVSTMESMDAVYEYTDYYYDLSVGLAPRLWDFCAYKNDLIVVNLGTNDVNPMRFYNNLNVADEEEKHFYSAYKNFIGKIRRLNGPASMICCTLGPLDYYLYDAIERAVDDYRFASNDERICCFKLIGVNLITEGFGALSHPSVKTHIRMGGELAARLKKLHLSSL